MGAVKPTDFTEIDAMRHSTAHVLAAAVMQMWPEAKLGVGPVIEHGFYYDVEVPEPITPQHLRKLEKRMGKIVAQNQEFRREEMPLDEAIGFFKERDQDFKVELLNAIKERGTTAVVNEEEAGEIDAEKPNEASVYYTGDFVDLCRGPHVATSKDLGAFALTTVAGAYWRGKEGNPQLQRIYGIAFPTKEELDAHIMMLEEAKKRDHRKLGQELDLFAFSPLVGPGLPLFTTKGTVMRREIEHFVMSLQEPLGYERVHIPHIAKSDLYKTSGHWDKFEDDLFHVSSKKSDDEFVLKPMNCPHHTQIFASQPRSYRDLPLRWAEVTTVYRDENTGQLQGLSRVRSITQDDAHVFCRMDQVEDEVKIIYDVITGFYKAFGMPLRLRLSVHDPANKEAYLGSSETWEKSEGALAEMLKSMGMDYELGVGEAAFYGPKIDFMAQDAIGREWQLATVQLDFNLPERFTLEYMGNDGEKHRPVMIHRAVLGSVERFMGILIEHFAGAFPVWLSPVQVQVIPVGSEHAPTCERFVRMLKEAGIRVAYEAEGGTVGNQIRKSAKRKVPYMVVIGEKEKDLATVQVRKRGADEDTAMATEEFIAYVTEKQTTRDGEL